MRITSLQDKSSEPVSHNPEIFKKVLIRNGEIPNISQLAWVVFKPGQVAQSHTHADMDEIFFIEQGEGLINVNGKSFPLTAGTCLTVEPKEPHEVINNGKGDLIVIIIGVLDRG